MSKATDGLPPIIVTMGQGSAERYQPQSRTIAISIRSPGSPIPTLSPTLGAVLWLEFEDDPFPGWGFRNKGMTAEQGRSVAKFIRDNEGKFDTPLIHCFVGVSRSVSMACALAMEGVGTYVGFPTRVPNRNVYVTTREAMKEEANG